MEHELPELSQLNAKIRQLRSLYEQYFQGIERIEPIKPREEIKKMITRLDGMRRNNTAFKFQLNSARQTFLTYEQYWNRIARQIEEGTYKRDKLRAQRRMQNHTAKRRDTAGHPMPSEQAELEQLHRAYLRARSQVGDSRPVPIRNFAQTVAKQTAAIKQKFECDKVEFKVVVKEGRAVLKAIPR